MRPELRQLAFQCLIDLSTKDGFNASGKDEIYGCIFGRDSALTILKILRVHSHQPSLELLEICRRALLTLVSLQGQEFNIESGEEPGKFIHEFRKDKYDHLLTLEKPWYLYPDKTLKNYDSIDSTPLTLIALYNYYQITQDGEFLISVLPAVEKGLNWILTFGDQDKDTLIEYSFSPNRNYGGLSVQSWTDSFESIMKPDGSLPVYPIAPVEVQGYAWLALNQWGNFYLQTAPEFGKKLLSQAKKLKKQFNESFVFDCDGYIFPAQALDGNKKQITTVTGNPLLLLWASNKTDSILDKRYIPDLVKRSFQDDLFNPLAGIRTMSTSSPTFNPTQNSYHNGSFWPILNGLAFEGLTKHGYTNEAELLREASLKPLDYFKSPIELYVLGDDGYLEYRNPSGQISCRQQAWSAAAMLDLLT